MCTHANSTLTKNFSICFTEFLISDRTLFHHSIFNKKYCFFCLGESTILSNLRLVVFVYFLPLQRMMRMEQRIGGRLMSTIESVSFSVTSKQGLNISVKDLAGWQLNKASPLVFPKTCHLLSWTNRSLNLCYSLNPTCLVQVLFSTWFDFYHVDRRNEKTGAVNYYQGHIMYIFCLFSIASQVIEEIFSLFIIIIFLSSFLRYAISVTKILCKILTWI